MKIYEDKDLRVCSQGCNKQYHRIGSDNGLAPTRRQAVVWNNDGYFTDAYMRHSASMGYSIFRRILFFDNTIKYQKQRKVRWTNTTGLHGAIYTINMQFIHNNKDTLATYHQVCMWLTSQVYLLLPPISYTYKYISQFWVNKYQDHYLLQSAIILTIFTTNISWKYVFRVRS